MNNQRADGGAIEGRKKHTAHRPVAEVFGLDPRALPSVEAIENVLACRRADGEAPRVGSGNREPLSTKVIESSLRKFKAAIGVPADGEVTADQVARVTTGQIDVAGYLKQINATTPPVAFVDLTFSADKSVSLSFALAPIEVERAIWLSIVQDATADAMAYAEQRIGVARRGAGGSGEAERAELAWQWNAQREIAHRIGAGGRFSLSVGVAGSGKTSSVAATLVDAWHAEAKTVYGMTVPWKASGALRQAGVDHAVAIEAFIRRVEAGQVQARQGQRHPGR